MKEQDNKLKRGDKIKFYGSDLGYEVLRVFAGGSFDLRSLQPQFSWMPDFYPIYYSINIREYELLK